MTPDTYIPILRNGRNERKAIRGFNESTLPGLPSQEVSMAPLMEITDEDDFQDFHLYKDAGKFLMVDLPKYLTERKNKFKEPVSKIIEEYGTPNRFYRENSGHIDVPVVSGPADPVDYSEYSKRVEGLQEEFDRVAVRLFIRNFSTTLTGDQKATLDKLSGSLRPEDIALFDLWETGVKDPLLEDLRFLSNVFSHNTKAVLNAFDAFDDQPDNHSPHIADDIDGSAFGDFGINQRFKHDGGGSPDTVKLRHYYPNHSTVKLFPGGDYMDAADNLTDWPEWDRTHCHGCRRAQRTTNEDPNTWAQIRMEHYFSSIVNGEI